MDLKTATDHALTWAHAELGEDPPLGVDASYQDPGRFLLLLDSKEYLEGRDDLAFLADAPWVTVDKASGRVDLLGWGDAQELARKMEPVAA